MKNPLRSNEPNKVVGTLFLLTFIAFCMYVLCKVIESKIDKDLTQTETEWKY